MTCRPPAWSVAFAFWLPALAAGSSLAPCDTIAANLIQNCGFESGDLSGWDLSGNTAGTFAIDDFDGFSPNSGGFFAALGPSGSDGLLSQTLSTNPGDFYVISWYFASDGQTPNDFNATWDGSSIFSQTDLAVPDYVLYSFTHVATSASTVLIFGFSSDLGYLALDDVSVTNSSAPVGGVPEPTTLGTAVVGAAGLFIVQLRRRRKFRKSPSPC